MLRNMIAALALTFAMSAIAGSAPTPIAKTKADCCVCCCCPPDCTTQTCCCGGACCK